MSTNSFNTESQNQFNINWPAYAWRFGGLILSLVIIAIGLFRESTALAVMGILLFVVFALLMIASIWALNRTNKATALQTAEILYKMSQARSSDSLACIDLGLRWPAITISQRLTSGRMHVIDIYNPQLMPAKSLLRARQFSPHALADPRLVWYDSHLELLPLPDGSVSAVFLLGILTEMAQKGDQQALLAEIGRILEPDGRLLLAEPANSWPNRLRPGSAVSNLHPDHYWNTLLADAGFEIQQTQTLQGVTICVRADKASPYASTQLTLGLDFEETS